MDRPSHREAVDLLKELGLKEYESACFVALSRLPHATAKEISDISEVPRTRVYDAVRVLDSKGLVETQHSSPKQFRALSVDEAIDLLRAEYRSKTETLRETLQSIEPVDAGTESNPPLEVWSLRGSDAIETRARRLTDDADHELVFVACDDHVPTDACEGALRTARQRDVAVTVGTVDGVSRQSFDLAEIETVTLETTVLEKAISSDEPSDIRRILLTDRNTVLISSRPTAGEEDVPERAVVGHGSSNGFVTIVRRLLLDALSPDSLETLPAQSSQS
ncbi:TrmB family transcriptional regulator [Halomicrococcus sp. NG-SE-24]|uniref:TrmB family transcriptional regulator n=1 Tax=Halomicrococcus sp. NG-SE-24 TaxID=3436928 RepID=UPI003D9734AD